MYNQVGFVNYSLVFLVRGASYEALYKTSFASVLSGFALRERWVKQNECKQSLLQSFIKGCTDYTERLAFTHFLRKLNYSKVEGRKFDYNHIGK